MRLTRHRITPFSPLTRSVALHGAVVLVALAGALALTACASTPGVGSGTPTVSASPDLAPTTWFLTRLLVDGAAQPLVAGRVPTLQFHPQDGTVSGNAGCNGYGGDYTLTGEHLSLSHMRQTLMACLGSSGLMEQEYAYTNALGRVTRLQLAGNTLTLSSSDGAVQLTYHPA